VIHQNVIKRRADEDGLPAPAVERDYVLAHVLSAISELDVEQQLVFKGGTSLRLCHFTDYRYSADLDFSLTGGVDAEGATRLIAAALVNCRERIGLPLLELDERSPPRIEYVGPLGAKPRFVKLDLAADELVEDTAISPRAARSERRRCRGGVAGVRAQGAPSRPRSRPFRRIVQRSGATLGGTVGQGADRVHPLAARVRRRLTLGQA
jgi:hypothetical protein